MKILFNVSGSGLHLLGEGGVDEKLKLILLNKNFFASYSSDGTVLVEGPDLVKGDEAEIKAGLGLREIRVFNEVRPLRIFSPPADSGKKAPP